MWFANFFIAGSITMVQPFLSLYIDTLGNFSDDYVQTWSGFIFSITFVSAFLFSPIWGKVGRSDWAQANSCRVRFWPWLIAVINGVCHVHLTVIFLTLIYGGLYRVYLVITSVNLNANVETCRW